MSAPTSLTLDASSETGFITNDDYTSQATPIIDATADAGDTVTFTVNGKTVTAVANSSGLAKATLPAGTLAVGANSITATESNSGGTSTASSPLTVTYAPNYSQVYTVPGAPGSSQTLTINWTSRQANYNDEIGVYEVSNATGTVNSIAPGSAGYAKAAIGGTTNGGQFAQVVFPSGDTGGETMTLNVTGGELLGFYMIQNNTTANFLAKNSANAVTSNANANQPMAFFTTTAANPNGGQHVQVTQDPTTGNVQYAWEDQVGGDNDFNDVVMTVALSSGQTTAPSTLHVPDTGGGNVKLSATLASGTHDTTAPGDVGVYFVDNPAGNIGSLTPGSSGYLAAGWPAATHRSWLRRAPPWRCRTIDQRAGRQVHCLLCDFEWHDRQLPDRQPHQRHHDLGPAERLPVVWRGQPEPDQPLQLHQSGRGLDQSRHDAIARHGRSAGQHVQLRRFGSRSDVRRERQLRPRAS